MDNIHYLLQHLLKPSKAQEAGEDGGAGTPIAPPLPISPSTPLSGASSGAEELGVGADSALDVGTGGDELPPLPSLYEVEFDTLNSLIVEKKSGDTKALPFQGAYKLSPETAKRMAIRWRRRHKSLTKTWGMQIKARRRAKKRELAKKYRVFEDFDKYYNQNKPNRPVEYLRRKLRHHYNRRLKSKRNAGLLWDIDPKLWKEWATSTLEEEGISSSDCWIMIKDWAKDYAAGNVGIRVTRGIRAGEEYIFTLPLTKEDI